MYLIKNNTDKVIFRNKYLPLARIEMNKLAESKKNGTWTLINKSKELTIELQTITNKF
jgi:hypothetical protein